MMLHVSPYLCRYVHTVHTYVSQTYLCRYVHTVLYIRTNWTCSQNWPCSLHATYQCKHAIIVEEEFSMILYVHANLGISSYCLWFDVLVFTWQKYCVRLTSHATQLIWSLICESCINATRMIRCMGLLTITSMVNMTQVRTFCAYLEYLQVMYVKDVL